MIFKILYIQQYYSQQGTETEIIQLIKYKGLGNKEITSATKLLLISQLAFITVKRQPKILIAQATTCIFFYCRVFSNTTATFHSVSYTNLFLKFPFNFILTYTALFPLLFSREIFAQVSYLLKLVFCFPSAFLISSYINESMLWRSGVYFCTHLINETHAYLI